MITKYNCITTFYFFSRTLSELQGNCGIVARMVSTMNSTKRCVGVSKTRGLDRVVTTVMIKTFCNVHVFSLAR